MRTLFFSLLSLFSSPAWSVASIESLGLTPDNALPGDAVEAIFRVDSGTPPGAAGVWVDNVQQCAARVRDGYFRCAFSVPHGGRFAYELRYRSVANSEIRLLQTALSGGLRIVKIQPQIPQAGRSALIFAKLDYFNPAAVPQPQGQIEIVGADNTQRCTITLPNQTHCQIRFNRAGRYSLRARYSGDNTYAALESTSSEVFVANPTFDHPIYLNENPLGSVLPDISTPRGAYALNPHANWLLTFERGVMDFNVGAQIPRFGQSAQSYQFSAQTGALGYGAGPSSSQLISDYTPRGERQWEIATSGVVRSLDGLKFAMLETIEPLDLRDNNGTIDWYSLSGDGAYWLSKKADGSARMGDLGGAATGTRAIAFVSAEPGFTTDDQDSLEDTFIARRNTANLRIPLPANRLEAPRPVRFNNAEQQLLLSTSLALTSEDQDQQIDIYLFDLITQQYRLISRNSDNIGFDGEAQFSPAGDVVFISANQSDRRLVVQPLSGARREWPLPPEYDANFRLLRITPSGQAALANGQGRRLIIDLQTGAGQISSGAVVGDERLLQAKDLSLSLDGSSLATASIGNEVLALRSDGAGRETLPAQFVSRTIIDDDPRYIAFVTSQALLPEDSNNAADVYEWDRRVQQVRRLSRRPDGAQTSGSSTLLAYSRSEGIALVHMSRSDLGVPNAANFLLPARIELASGVVSPVLGFVSTAYFQIVNSRNGRWILAESNAPNPDKLVRIDTRNSALTPVDALLGGAYTLRSRTAISDNGQRALVPILLSAPTRSEVRLVDFANNSARAVFQTADRAITAISPDGRSALIGTQRFFGDVDPLPPPFVLPLPLYVLDLERNLVSEQIGLARDRSFGFSGDGSTLAWLGANGNLPTGNVMLRDNPYFRTPSFTAIVRVQPALPTRTETLLVEAVVSHKDTGPAASGIVRFDDGYGAQCDAVLEAQGELAIARCRLLPNAESLADGSTLSLRANYLGDQRYGGSLSLRSVQASKVAPVRTAVFADPGLPNVGVSVQIDALPGQPFTGSARVQLGALGEHAPCFLNALELQAGIRCRFFVARAGATAVTVTMDDPRYTLGSGLLGSLLIREQSIFAHGFE